MAYQSMYKVIIIIHALCEFNLKPATWIWTLLYQVTTTQMFTIWITFTPIFIAWSDRFIYFVCLYFRESVESKAIRQSIDSFSNNVKGQLLEKVRLSGYRGDEGKGRFWVFVWLYLVFLGQQFGLPTLSRHKSMVSDQIVHDFAPHTGINWKYWH